MIIFMSKYLSILERFYKKDAVNNSSAGVYVVIILEISAPCLLKTGYSNMNIEIDTNEIYYLNIYTN